MLRALTKLVPATSFQPPSPQRRRLFHSSARTTISITLPTSNIPTPLPDFQEDIKAKRLEQLISFLRRKEIPHGNVWQRYINFLHIADNEYIPLEIHQAVLRRCTPPSKFLRAQIGQRSGTAAYHRSPHALEYRLQTIIRNIRSAGLVPSLEDYHFVLEQFAATGHFTGSYRVYTELTSRGLLPRSRTFGLCLQAIAHRLTLPIPLGKKLPAINKAVKMCRFLMQEMLTYKTPCTSGNLDLAIRILKENADLKTYELLCKIAYGIDLSYPDYIDIGFKNPGAKSAQPIVPFSTSALNTTIDFLGRLGQIPKMIQAFEVLTQPLQHSATFFDNDDEFGGVNPPEPQPVEFPHANPNTTTYNLLLKHVCRRGPAVFARHYLREAIYLDELTDRNLRGHIEHGKPLHELHAPRLSINKGTVLPAFGFSNRRKKVELMRRILAYLRRIIRRKTLNLEFYESMKTKLAIPDPEDAIPEVPPSPQPQPQPPTHVMDVELETEVESKPPPVKYFDINLHISILKRDRGQIIQFYFYALNIFARTVQRIKERLGRRVWAGKNIYLLARDLRMMTSKSEWQQVVHYKHHGKTLEGSLPSLRRGRMARAWKKRTLRASARSGTTEDALGS